MKNIKWFYPETLKEADKLIKDGYKAHGGGTFLVKTSLKVDGLFHLAGIPELRQSSTNGDSMMLGSALSYSETAELLEAAVPGNFLSGALGSAAACPLRNRISLGGSIYTAPKWSDLTGPLLASGASLKLSPSGKTVPAAEYYADRELRQSGIITQISIPKKNIAGGYYRFTQTNFDYPIFTITVSVRGKDNYLCVLTGSSSGPIEFKGSLADITDPADFPDFNKERGMSGEYIRTRAKIEYNRLLKRSGGN